MALLPSRYLASSCLLDRRAGRANLRLKRTYTLPREMYLYTFEAYKYPLDSHPQTPPTSGQISNDSELACHVVNVSALALKPEGET